MKFGAFALIDVLGFKEIARRHPPDAVLARMKVLRDTFHSLQDSLSFAHVGVSFKPQSRYINFTPHFAFLSDTVVAALSVPPGEECRFGAQVMIQLLAHWVRLMTQHAFQGEPTFLFRGCISAGSFLVEDNFILGDAVNEAAALHEQADAAIVWLAPSALVALEDIPRAELRAFLAPCEVPIKNGSSFRSMAVLPTPHLGEEADWPALKARMLAYFTEPSLGVQIKRQNTERYFDQVERLPAAESHFPAISPAAPPTAAWLSMQEVPAEPAVP